MNLYSTLKKFKTLKGNCRLFGQWLFQDPTRSESHNPCFKFLIFLGVPVALTLNIKDHKVIWKGIKPRYSSWLYQ